MIVQKIKTTDQDILLVAQKYYGILSVINKLNLTEREIEVYDIYHKLNKQNKHKIIQIPIFKKNEIHTS